MKRRYNIKNLYKESTLQIIIIMLLIIVFACVYVYNNTLSVIKKQTIQNSLTDTKNFGERIDKYILQAKTMINYLSVEKDTGIYFSLSNNNNLDYQLNLRLKSRLDDMILINKYISSIYLYKNASPNVCFTRNGIENINGEKKSIIERVLPESTESGIKIIPYALDGNYPYYIVAVKTFYVNSERCMIILNIDIEELIDFVDVSMFEEIYIYNGDYIIYCKNMDHMFSEIKDDDALSKVNKHKSTNIMKLKNKNMVISSYKSNACDWNYATATLIDPYNKDIVEKRLFLYVFTALVLCAGFVILLVYRKEKKKIISTVSRVVENPETALNKDNKTSEEITLIANRIYNYINANDELRRKIEQRDNDNIKLQLQVVSEQINPHFMFNILNLIYMQSIEDFDYKSNTSKMLLKLATYLRFVLKNDRVTVPVKDEVENSKMYVDMLKLRYPKLKKVVWTIDDNVMDNLILKLCLQPIIENAVYHGICYSEKDTGEILVEISKQSKCIEITIKDDGIGMTEEQLRKIEEYMKADNDNQNTHIGIRNVYRRIRLLYGEPYTMEISSVYGSGTTVKMIMPIIEGE